MLCLLNQYPAMQGLREYVRQIIDTYPPNKRYVSAETSKITQYSNRISKVLEYTNMIV